MVVGSRTGEQTDLEKIGEGASFFLLEDQLERAGVIDKVVSIILKRACEGLKDLGNSRLCQSLGSHGAQIFVQKVMNSVDAGEMLGEDTVDIIQ